MSRTFARLSASKTALAMIRESSRPMRSKPHHAASPLCPRKRTKRADVLGRPLCAKDLACSLSLRGEDRFRDHAVDPLGAVDHLGDVIIDGYARDHVGLLAS